MSQNQDEMPKALKIATDRINKIMQKIDELPEGELHKIDELQKINELVQGVIFRGENKKYPNISSSLYRFHEDILKNDQFRSQIMSIMQKDIIDDVRRRRLLEYKSTADILTELRHYEGKTTFVDFSCSVHIALFFACYGQNGSDGRLILYHYEEISQNVEDDDFEKQKDFCFKPNKINKRIIFQKSVFVHAHQGTLTVDKKQIQIIPIKKENKPKILDYLKKHHDIHENTIYDDLIGFIANENNFGTAITEFIEGYSKQSKGAHKQAIGHHEEAIDFYKKAIKHYEEAIKIKPNYYEAYNNKGVAYDKLGQPEKAIECYERALEIKPDEPEAYNNIGLAYNGLGKSEKAIECYNKALKIKPNFHEAYNNKGVAYNGLKDYEKAIECFDKALEIKPDKHDAYNNMGNAYNGLGESKKAIECYERALEIKPDKHEAHNNMGNAYASLKDYKKAIECYEKALEIKPDYYDAYNNMGNAYYELEEYDKAIEWYKKAIKINPYYSPAYNNMGNAYADLGQPDKADECFKKAREIESQRLDAEPN